MCVTNIFLADKNLILMHNMISFYDNTIEGHRNKNRLDTWKVNRNVILASLDKIHADN